MGREMGRIFMGLDIVTRETGMGGDGEPGSARGARYPAPEARRVTATTSSIRSLRRGCFWDS
jgi:hypothetical protein